MDINQLNRPIVTGSPALQPQTGAQAQQPQVTGPSFQQVLQQQLNAAGNTAFSKHAVQRVIERNIDVSEQNLQRLNQGMELAREKGLKDALILIDQNAYIVNAASQRVVTVDGQAASGSVFTNIDGTVIV